MKFHNDLILQNTCIFLHTKYIEIHNGIRQKRHPPSYSICEDMENKK